MKKVLFTKTMQGLHISNVCHKKNVASYGLGVEAVKETFGPTLGAPVPLAVW
jgi:hypothetical protein